LKRQFKFKVQQGVLPDSRSNSPEWECLTSSHTTAKMTLERYARYIKRKDKKRAKFLEKSFGHNLVTMEKVA